MDKFTPILFAFLAAVKVLAEPSTLFLRDTIIKTSTTGNAGGYYFSCYIENGSGATMDIGNGIYDLQWNDTSEDVVAGIGWETGAARNISYLGYLSATGDSLLALYGWTTDPLVEYYVIDTYGTYNPGSSGTHMGAVDSDDGTYDVYVVVRSDAPSIQGTQTFNQYLSIRQDKRTSGTITFPNHIAAWASFGMDLGTYNYQIMATEGYESNGTSCIEFS